MKVLVIGASGMLGNAVLRLFAQSPEYQIFGSVRSASALRFLPSHLHPNIIADVDAENTDDLTRLFIMAQPDMVINCVGLVKQLAEAHDPLSAILINALFPHRLAKLCEAAGARFVHMSTDCIFSGTKGLYTEADASDAKDLYGRSKFLGEVDYPHAITLRTSIIGHELNGAHSLIGWFLSQEGSVKGFKRAIFSGLPTVEIARLIRDHVIPHPELHGVYHVSAEPISKLDLLTIVARQYGKRTDIVPDETFVLDRSLDSTRFRAATGFDPAPWPELIRLMHAFS